MDEHVSTSSAFRLTVGAVERDTGLTRDTLRTWERRYGFPRPQRDATGESSYSLEQLPRLRLIKRLIDAGHRPCHVVGLTPQALERLNAPAAEAKCAGGSTISSPLAAPQELLDGLRAHDAHALRAQLLQAQARLGLRRFVLEVVVPLESLVTEAWLHGTLEAFERALFAELAEGVLQAAMVQKLDEARPDRPRVMLATLPGERHSLGLAMGQALLAAEGADCCPLGLQVGLWDIVLAVRAQRSDIAALRFSESESPNRVVEALSELRAKLPLGCELWVGGPPLLQRRPVAGVRALSSWAQWPAGIERWRRMHD